LKRDSITDTADGLVADFLQKCYGTLRNHRCYNSVVLPVVTGKIKAQPQADEIAAYSCREPDAENIRKSDVF
jgi:hypothetical protein